MIRFASHRMNMLIFDSSYLTNNHFVFISVWYEILKDSEHHLFMLNIKANLKITQFNTPQEFR